MFRWLNSTSVAVLSLVLVSCTVETPPPVAPTPAPVVPSVSLNPLIPNEASIYVDYVLAVQNIDTQFSSEEAIKTSLIKASSFEVNQFSRSIIAYSSIVALQDAEFRTSLREYAANPTTRAQLFENLTKDYSYVLSIKGSESAAKRIIHTLSEDGQKLYTKGEAIKDQAKLVQSQPWSLKINPNRVERLLVTKEVSSTPKSVNLTSAQKLLRSAIIGDGVHHTNYREKNEENEAQGFVIQGDQVTVAAPNADDGTDKSAENDKPNAYSPTIAQALTIAALSGLGESGPHLDPWLNQALELNEAVKCNSLAKLNLYQCLAASQPYYEDLFCMGQHIYMDTGHCVANLSSSNINLTPIKLTNENNISKNEVPYLTPPKTSLRKDKISSNTKAASSTKDKKTPKAPVKKGSKKKKT